MMNDSEHFKHGFDFDAIDSIRFPRVQLFIILLKS